LFGRFEGSSSAFAETNDDMAELDKRRKCSDAAHNGKRTEDAQRPLLVS
jgi:hypothetical protein